MNISLCVNMSGFCSDSHILGYAYINILNLLMSHMYHVPQNVTTVLEDYRTEDTHNVIYCKLITNAEATHSLKVFTVVAIV